MTLSQFLKTNITNAEFFASKKPKYDKEEAAYVFENDSLVCLNQYDDKQVLLHLTKPIIKQLEDTLEDATFKDYTNTDALAGIINVDKNTSLLYQDNLIPQLCSLALIESERASFSFMIIKLVNDQLEECLVWLKLKAPLKIENNMFVNNHFNYQVAFTKDGVTFDNYPTFNLDISLISFILYDKEFYILEKELYQKYFNLDSFYLYEATNLVYNNNRIISDGSLLTKGNAKFIYDHFYNVEDLFVALEDETISKDKLIETIAS
ncbi:MAG: hypothetical protein ACRCTA_01445, partial [Bacilli bacterium]